jgi:predicted dienelactone hydrolase
MMRFFKPFHAVCLVLILVALVAARGLAQDSAEPESPDPAAEPGTTDSPEGEEPADPPPPSLWGEGATQHDIARIVTTLPRDDAAADPDRDALTIRITHPTTAGKQPLVVFSHGAGGTHTIYNPLIDAWARHGYIVVQPQHADSRTLNRGRMPGFGNWAQRPAEIALILDSLPLIQAKLPGAGPQIDTKRIGVGGHSFGAHTSQLIGGTTSKPGLTTGGRGARRNGGDEDDKGDDEPARPRRLSFADPRVSVCVLISPQGRGSLLDETSFTTLTTPAIIITGSNDIGRNGEPWTWRLEPFTLAPADDKYLCTIDEAWHDFGGITGVRHSGSRPANPDHVRLVQAASLAMLDAYLRDDAGAKAFLTSKAMRKVTEGTARIVTRSDPDAPKAGDAPADAGDTGAGDADAGDRSDEPEGDASPAEQRAKQFLDRLDRDGDGKLSGDEVPQRLRRILPRLDTNNDGALDAKELAPIVERLGGLGGR